LPSTRFAPVAPPSAPPRGRFRLCGLINVIAARRASFFGFPLISSYSPLPVQVEIFILRPLFFPRVVPPAGVWGVLRFFPPVVTLGILLCLRFPEFLQFAGISNHRWLSFPFPPGTPIVTPFEVLFHGVFRLAIRMICNSGHSLLPSRRVMSETFVLTFKFFLAFCGVVLTVFRRSQIDPLCLIPVSPLSWNFFNFTVLSQRL